MSDEPNEQQSKPDVQSGEDDAPSADQAEQTPFDGANPKRRRHGPNRRGDSSDSPALRFLGRLTINEWLTFLVGLGSLAVALLTYLNAADTSDLKAAVKGLTTLAYQASIQASQTKREADALRDQLTEVRHQSTLLQTQANAAQVSAATAQEAQRDARDQMRPVVTVQSATMMNIANGMIPIAEVSITNEGFMVANHYITWGSAQVGDVPLLGPIHTRRIPRSEPGVLGKDYGDTLKIYGERALSTDEINAINAGAKALYIFGEVSYVDPYDGTQTIPIRLRYAGPPRGPQRPVEVAPFSFGVIEDR